MRPITAPGELTYEYSDGGVTVRKTFRFDDTYVFHVETAVTQNGKTGAGASHLARRLRRSGDRRLPTPPRVEYMAEGKVERLAAKKVSGGNTLRGPLNWAGPQDQYLCRHLPA